MRKPIILDCDPGHDDAIMMLMALASSHVEVKLITTSAGNQTPEKTYQNARKLLALVKREDIKVCQGANKPLKRDLIIAKDIHGETGLDGAVLPEPTASKNNQKAWDAMAEVICKSEEKVTIIATGPLTNIAIFLLTYPELKEKIEMISFMGGACFGGNYTAVAEFNIYVDPEACDIVLHAQVPLVMSGLDVTMKAQFFQADIDELRNLNTEVGLIIADLLDFFHQTTTQPLLAKDHHEEGIHMHDPCALAYVLNPSLFTGFMMHVDVITTDGITLGQTVVDYSYRTHKPKNVYVLFDVELPAFRKLIKEAIAFFK